MKMIKGPLVLVVALLSLHLPQSASQASGWIGAEAPSFRVRSGDDKELTLKMIKGKAVVMFYEAKDIVEKNRRLKNQLNKFYHEQADAIKQRIVRVAIIDCSGAVWPFKGIWKSRLRESSKKEGISIYGDWDGKMFSDYKMKTDESNILIIDKDGRIKFFTSGEVKDEEINEVKELLKELAAEQVK